MKFFLLSLLLSLGCTHLKPEQPSTVSDRDKQQYLKSIEDQLEKINSKTRSLEYMTDYLLYDSVNTLCFKNLEICTVDRKTECLETLLKCGTSKQCTNQYQKCKTTSQSKCFGPHEKCIINNYHWWLNIMKLKGYK